VSGFALIAARAASATVSTAAATIITVRSAMLSRIRGKVGAAVIEPPPKAARVNATSRWLRASPFTMTTVFDEYRACGEVRGTATPGSPPPRCVTCTPGLSIRRWR
jgi:hypothetical protein